MKTNFLRIIALSSLLLFIWMTPAQAVNWVLATRMTFEDEEDAFAPSNEYIDADSVVLDGNSMFFWNLSVYYGDDNAVTGKTLRKHEVLIYANPRQSRSIFNCSYTPDNVEVPHMKSTRPGQFSNVLPGTYIDIIINAAQRYAKPGKDNGVAFPPHL
ncbi:MAG: hypothetical protein PHY31_04580 [Smithellaceae bacterium]|nr:hypothetical protein [Smithellaceae bacterium]